MIITTTSNVPGMEIVEYRGFATGEVVAGINFLRDMGAGLRNFFGGRSQGYEEEIIQARKEALIELQERAANMGANAVIGIRVDFDTLGQGGSMLLVTATGTAVVVR
ncbi:YbjQ family protein [Gemella bergeri]